MITGFHVAVSLLCLHFSRDSQGAAQKMTGPAVLVTNGSQTLTLTCPDVAEAAGYEWFTPEPDTQRCQPRTNKVCTFNPTLEDDGKDVTCNVLGNTGTTLQQSTYTVNLNYPPKSGPVIKPEPSGVQIPQDGDIITCTVSGGKPRVANVRFYCRQPEIQDQADSVSADERNVSSSITVNIPEEVRRSLGIMHCSCSAYWEPKPELYTLSSNITYDLRSNKQSRFMANALEVAAFVAVVIMCVT